MKRFVVVILALCCFCITEPMVLALAAPAVPVVSTMTVPAVIKTSAALGLAVGGLYSFIAGLKRGKNHAVAHTKNNHNNNCWCGCGPCNPGCGCPSPKNGQKAFDNSIPRTNNSTGRIGVSEGQIVVLSKTCEGVFHGHVITLAELIKNKNFQGVMKRMIKAGLLNEKGITLK